MLLRDAYAEQGPPCTKARAESAQPDGALQVRANAHDMAGNQGTSAAVAFTLDSTGRWR